MKMDSTTSLTKSRETIVLFVGSNPSNASLCDTAFHGSTRSSQILTRWCQDIPLGKMMVNVLTKKTENNRPLTIAEIKEALPQLQSTIDALSPCKVIALGKTAARALTLLRQPHYEMPHPSGRNRKLNDKKYEAEKVKGLIEFCSTSPISESNS